MVVVRKTVGAAAKTTKANRRRGRRMSRAAPPKRRARRPAIRTWPRFNTTLVQRKGRLSPRRTLLPRFSAAQVSRTAMALRRRSCSRAASMTPLAGQTITAWKVSALH
ncbi:hypothetical protein D3C81_1912500 [compost metagenome]